MIPILPCLVTKVEIHEALIQIKSGKAPGPDVIFAEIFKLGGTASIQWLKAIADQVWMEGTVPCDCRKELIIPLDKKGSQSDCDNYRGITLLSAPGYCRCEVQASRQSGILLLYIIHTEHRGLRTQTALVLGLTLTPNYCKAIL